jgi:hypothetical protein
MPCKRSLRTLPPGSANTQRADRRPLVRTSHACPAASQACRFGGADPEALYGPIEQSYTKERRPRRDDP